MNLNTYIESVKSDLALFIKENTPKTTPDYLYAPIQYSLESGGKKIRPALLMLVAEYLGAERQETLKPAAGLELFHIFSLVHDDIMDHDVMRRGRPTVHTKWDEATAILAGDGLIALSNIFMMKYKHPRLADILSMYSDTILAVCEGQAFDKEFESRENVTIDEYINMIGLKTAYLLGASTKIGAIIASENQDDWERFYQFGFNLGIAFQIQDDILDLFADLDELGKDIGSDIFNQKNSILTIYAREAGVLPTYTPEMDKTEFIALCKQELKRCGVFDKSVQLKEHYTSVALNQLQSYPEAIYKQMLLELVSKLNNRTS